MAVLDAGAGTGFTTEGIVARVDAAQVTMLDQSPHQLARSRAKPALADCPRVLGDAESPPVRRRQLRPLRLRRLDRVLAGPAARDRRGLPRDARRRHGAGDRPGAPGQPRRAGAGRDLDAVPGRRRSTPAGWRPRASTTCAWSSWRRTGTATSARPYALAVSGVKPVPGPSPAAVPRRRPRSR